HLVRLAQQRGLARIPRAGALQLLPALLVGEPDVDRHGVVRHAEDVVERPFPLRHGRMILLCRSPRNNALHALRGATRARPRASSTNARIASEATKNAPVMRIARRWLPCVIQVTAP